VTLTELNALPTAEMRLAAMRSATTDLKNEIFRLSGIVSAHQQALRHWRKGADLDAAVIHRLRHALYTIAHTTASERRLQQIAKDALDLDCTDAMGRQTAPPVADTAVAPAYNGPRKHQPFEYDPNATDAKQV
jgi:hypothetical protein